MESFIHLSGYQGSPPGWPASDKLTSSVASIHLHTNDHMCDLFETPSGRTEDQVGTTGVCLSG